MGHLVEYCLLCGREIENQPSPLKCRGQEYSVFLRQRVLQRSLQTLQCGNKKTLMLLGLSRSRCATCVGTFMDARPGSPPGACIRATWSKHIGETSKIIVSPVCRSPRAQRLRRPRVSTDCSLGRSPSPPCIAEATAGGIEAVGASSSVDTTGDAVAASAGVVTGVEWVEYWDESAGASYFFNTVTQVW